MRFNFLTIFIEIYFSSCIAFSSNGTSNDGIKTTDYSLQLCRDYSKFPLINTQTVHVVYMFDNLPENNKYLDMIRGHFTSLIELRSCPLHLHFNMDKSSKSIMNNILKSINKTEMSIEIDYYNDEIVEKAQESLKYFHSNANREAWPHKKTLHRASPELLPLPLHIKEIIMLDFDTLLLRDICVEYYNYATFMEVNKVGALLAPDGSGMYASNFLTRLNAIVPLVYKWGVAYIGMNSGVVMANLINLRQANWTETYISAIHARILVNPRFIFTLPEQNIYNMMARLDNNTFVRFMTPGMNMQFIFRRRIKYAWIPIYLNNVESTNFTILHGNAAVFLHDPFFEPFLLLFAHRNYSTYSQNFTRENDFLCYEERSQISNIFYDNVVNFSSTISYIQGHIKHKKRISVN